jgi:hypothetical protein
MHADQLPQAERRIEGPQCRRAINGVSGIVNNTEVVEHLAVWESNGRPEPATVAMLAAFNRELPIAEEVIEVAFGTLCPFRRGGLRQTPYLVSSEASPKLGTVS